MESPKLYHELADWWPLMSSPADYAEEAEAYRRLMIASGAAPLRTVLELGSGGGNNASHLKAHFDLTLVEISPGMLEVSRRINPDLRHFQGDMRAIRLGEEFDGVFVHDAICYMTTPDDLRRAMETAFVHCRPGAGIPIPRIRRTLWITCTRCVREQRHVLYTTAISKACSAGGIG
jgi:SAM-dependent methyltransferase